MRSIKPIRLYWGENYSEKPIEIRQALERATKAILSTIQLYPGPLYQEAVNLVAKSLQVEDEQIIFGHGIEGLIHLTAQAFLGVDKIGGMFEPSFFVFGNNLARYKSVQYPCHYDRKIDFGSFTKTLKKTDLFFLASPNTDTGNYLLTKDEIEKVLQIYRGLLVVDECYFGFGDQTVVDRTKKYENLLVYRGMTKVMGMGALRLAFAVGNKKIIDKLRYHQNDVELDPINSFSLKIFTETYPYFDLLAITAKKFFADFLEYMKNEFPNDRFIPTLTTYQFMDRSNYVVPTYRVSNYLTKHGYVMSEKNLMDDSSIAFPELIKLTPPPKKYWRDFAHTLKLALLQRV